MKKKKSQEHLPLYLRGIDRAKAERIVQHFAHNYQPPIECAHKFGKPYRAVGKDRNVVLRRCESCSMVIGHVA